MGARTGEAYLKGLRTHDTRGLAGRRAGRRRRRPPGAPRWRRSHRLRYYDLQFEQPDVLLIDDPETGEPINVSHMQPRSVEDLRRRGVGLRAHRRAERGRDGPHARLHERHVRRFRRRSGALGGRRRQQRGRLREPRRVPEAASPRRPVADPHHHPSDRRQGSATRDFTDNPVPLHKVGETKDVDRRPRRAGCSPRSRRSPTSSTVYPGAAAAPGRADGVRARRSGPDGHTGTDVPVPRQRTAGQRRSGRCTRSRPASTSRTPSCIFDDVEVPQRERLFIDGNIAVYNPVMAPSSWWPNIMQQTTTPRTRRSWSSPTASRVGWPRRSTTRPSGRSEMLGEILGYVEMTRSALTCAIDNAQTWESGAVYSEGRAAAPVAVAPAGLVHSDQRPSSRPSAATTCWRRRASTSSPTPGSAR